MTSPPTARDVVYVAIPVVSAFLVLIMSVMVMITMIQQALADPKGYDPMPGIAFCAACAAAVQAIKLISLPPAPTADGS